MGRKTIDREKFALLVASGMPKPDAYTQAGGVAKNIQAIRASACKLANNPEVAKMIQDYVFEKAMDTQVELVALGPLALQVRRDILENKKTLEDGTRVKHEYADKMRKDVSDSTLAGIRDVLPKTVNINQNVQHSIDESLDELLEQLINLRPEEAKSFIEGEIVEESGADEEASDSSSEER